MGKEVEKQQIKFLFTSKWQISIFQLPYGVDTMFVLMRKVSWFRPV